MAERLPLAWYQLIRQPRRLITAVVGIAFAALLVFMQVGFETALLNSATAIYRNLDADLVLVARGTVSLSGMLPFSRANLFRLAGMPGVAQVSPAVVFPVVVRSPLDGEPLNLLAIGSDPDRPLLKLEGQDLAEASARLNTRGQVLLDALSSPKVRRSLVERFRREGPSDVLLADRSDDFRLVGLFRLGSAFAGEGTALMSDATLLSLIPRRLTPGAIQLGAIRLDPALAARGEEELRRLARQLQPLVTDDVVVLTRAQLEASERAYWSKTTAIGFIFRFGTIMGLVVGSVIVYQILFADVADHLDEYATLMAIGFRNRYLQAVVMQQALLLALLGFLPGWLVSAGFYALTTGATGIQLSMGLDRTLSVFGLVLTMCLISGWMALRPLQGADPAEVF